jgi:acetyl-CoA carboxylase biotin carboxyl carrier protein
VTELDVRTIANGQIGSPPGGRDAEPIDAELALGQLCESLSAVLQAAVTPPSRISLRCGAASVEVEWPTSGTAVAPALAVAVAPAPVATPAPDTRHAVTAPLVGTFYRAGEPGARAFVEVGDVVQPGQQVAIVEAMKLMNSVEADQAGRVAEILVADGESVEYAQPLILLEPVDGER